VSTIPGVLERIESTFESRGRRALLWAAAAGVLAAGIFAATNGGGEAQTTGAPQKLPSIAQVEQHKYGHTITPPKEAIAVAQRFIANVVLRANLLRSYDDTTAKLRGATMTREHWATGSIPVVPYSAADFGKAGIKIERAREKSILLLVLITPKRGSTAPQQDYYLELVPSGGRWLVNYWAPKGRLDAPVPLAKP
jgi:hypothetical protein